MSRGSRPTATPPPDRRPLLAGFLVLALAALLFLPSGSQPTDPVPSGNLPPADLRFEISPPGLPGLNLVVVEPDRSQGRFDPSRPLTFDVSGKYHWTVTAPGYHAAAGHFELPLPESERTVRVELVPLGRKPGTRGVR